MPFDPTTIAVGKCYVTLTGQVRKVQEIDGDRVKYVHRGKKATPGWETGQWRWASKSTFAADVDQEVACDWDPDYTSKP